MRLSSLFAISSLLVVGSCPSSVAEKSQTTEDQQDTSSNNLRRKTYILPEKKEEEERYFVQFKPGRQDSARAFLQQRSSTGTRMVHDFSRLMDTYVVTTNEKDLKAMRANPDILTIARDVKRYAQYLPESVKRGDHRNLQGQVTPYGIEMVRANEVWPEGAVGTNVKVCVVDTGIDAGHPDFVTLEGNDDAPLRWGVDPVGHGTHCSGTIAAANNDFGVVGVAPNATIYTVRVFGDNGGFAYASGLVAAAQECERVGSQVVSMSLGGPLPNPFEFLAYRNLLNRGIVTVAAAGNSGNGWWSFPASYFGVVSVGAVDSDKNKASFSQYNRQVDLAAPGVDVYSTFPRQKPCSICDRINEFTYGTISGTSMATPHVAGVVALLLGAFPEVDADVILDVMFQTAEDLGDSGKDREFGHGLVDAKASYDALKTMTQAKSASTHCMDDNDEVAFSLTLKTDGAASETSWELVRLTDSQVHLSGDGYKDHETVEVMSCIPRDCYAFIVTDVDGICCDKGKGYYSLQIGDDVVVGKGGNFAREESTVFGECRALEEQKQQMGAMTP